MGTMILQEEKEETEKLRKPNKNALLESQLTKRIEKRVAPSGFVGQFPVAAMSPF